MRQFQFALCAVGSVAIYFASRYLYTQDNELIPVLIALAFFVTALAVTWRVPA